MPEDRALDAVRRAFVRDARTAILATIAPDGRPRLVPICLVLAPPDRAGPDRIYSPIDEKRKAIADPRRLARVRDLVDDPRASLLIERWSEEWDRLGWIRLETTGAVLEPGAGGTTGRERSAAIDALRSKYPQYATHRLEGRPILRFTVLRAVAWGDLAPD